MNGVKLEIAVAPPGNIDGNRLLAGLPAAVQGRLLPHLDLVDMPLGKVLLEHGCTPRRLYFPTTSIASILNQAADGASEEAAAVGSEGAVGIELFLGGYSTLNRAMVRGAGEGLGLRAQPALQEFHQGGAFMQVMLRYVQARLVQTAQAAVCSGRHLLEQQLCRWLLVNLEGACSDELTMTHDLARRTAPYCPSLVRHS